MFHEKVTDEQEKLGRTDDSLPNLAALAETHADPEYSADAPPVAPLDIIVAGRLDSAGRGVRCALVLTVQTIVKRVEKTRQS